jgi:hypothetical protein
MTIKKNLEKKTCNFEETALFQCEIYVMAVNLSFPRKKSLQNDQDE